jgi:hypothetical protein
MNPSQRIGLLLFLLFITGSTSSGQFFEEDTVTVYDTTYIKAYRDELTTRFFISRKQNGYNLSPVLLKPWIRYRSNDNLLLGLGYTYSFLTINLSVKMPFINRDDETFGKTNYIDLQAHSIFRTYIVDFYLQWTKGYYLSNPENIYRPPLHQGEYPVRGDMRTTILGLNVQYLFNSSRYSYKAAFLQNQFQRRSAGSPIAGIEGYWMLGMTDSVMVDNSIPPSGFLGDQPFNQVDIANVGINGGYAYTFVWKEKLYLSLSEVIGLSGGYNQVHHSNSSTTHYRGLTAGFTSSTRISLGFNSHDYYVGLSLIHFTMSNLTGGGYGDRFTFSTGNLRINFVKRFRLKKPIKALRPDLWIL